MPVKSKKFHAPLAMESGWQRVMPKSQPLCTGAELNLRDRVLGEIEKNSFIALPGKGGCSVLLLSKRCVRIGEDLVRSFIVMVQGQGCDKVQGLPSFNPASGGLLMSFEFIKLWPSLLNIFHLVGVLVLQKNLKILLCVSLEVEPGPYPKAALLFLYCSSLVFPEFMVELEEWEVWTIRIFIGSSWAPWGTRILILDFFSGDFLSFMCDSNCNSLSKKTRIQKKKCHLKKMTHILEFKNGEVMILKMMVTSKTS